MSLLRMCGAVRSVPHYLNAHILNAEMQQDFLVESILMVWIHSESGSRKYPLTVTSVWAQAIKAHVTVCSRGESDPRQPMLIQIRSKQN